MELASMIDEFTATITAFLEHRKAHGGIMLPDVVIVENAFQEALYETGLRTRPEAPVIIDQQKKAK